MEKGKLPGKYSELQNLRTQIVRGRRRLWIENSYRLKKLRGASDLKGESGFKQNENAERNIRRLKTQRILLMTDVPF